MQVRRRLLTGGRMRIESAADQRRGEPRTRCPGVEINRSHAAPDRLWMFGSALT
jgi:hypothetical protein